MTNDAPAFAVVGGADGRKVSLTLAGAANLLRSIPEGDYAYSAEIENARVAWKALGDSIGVSAEEAAKQAMDIASEKIWEIAVATAAPLTPICSIKIKTGSCRIFNTAPTATEHIPAIA